MPHHTTLFFKSGLSYNAVIYNCNIQLDIAVTQKVFINSFSPKISIVSRITPNNSFSVNILNKDAYYLLLIVSSGGRSSRLSGLLISHRALCGFESRPRRNFSLGYGCCDCP
ncbi:unnamed protein product [Acanthoscelides obtectus]|uniref:Uncharacterized protein n=1 Tax=Acanthoscelides obtectus TaxID=200917 RepID=A0A9P0JQW0_ACAOB|nr:unnamed protein product [Acanthoscelides obtectus]CAK1661907.1 hypothetical protein AOBTE_LOCUS22870 [Acanthoscelides obtectus]